MNKIKGSTKFWSIILIPLLLFLNYRSVDIFTNNLNNENSVKPVIIAFLWMTQGIIILLFILPIIFGKDGLLNKLNNWLDENF